VAISFDRHGRFSKFVAIGKHRFNVSEKRKRSRQLTCGLTVCGFKISVLFIFGSVWTQNIKILMFTKVFVQRMIIIMLHIMFFVVVNSVFSVIRFFSSGTLETWCSF
jgi:hypothetical protein